MSGSYLIVRAFSDTSKAQSHQTEAGELSHDDWQNHCVQESTEEHQVTQVLMTVLWNVNNIIIQDSVQSADHQIIAIEEFDEYNCKWPKILYCQDL